jgi:hypothetical protein
MSPTTTSRMCRSSDSVRIAPQSGRADEQREPVALSEPNFLSV